MIAYTDTAKDGGSRKNLHVVANDGALHLSIVAKRYQLQAIEVTAYALGIQIGGVIMLKMGTRTYRGTSDVECGLWWQHPFDEYRNVFP